MVVFPGLRGICVLVADESMSCCSLFLAVPIKTELQVWSLHADISPDSVSDVTLPGPSRGRTTFNSYPVHVLQ